MSSIGTEVVACAGGSAMTSLLHDIAGLPQVRGSLSVKLLAQESSSGFCLVRTDTGAKIPVAVVQGGEAEGYARMLSGAPVMLDLLTTLLVRWGDAVADDEINGGDAVAWLSQYTAEVREALQAIVGPLPPEPAP